jgi:hypothetical protein
MLEAKELFYYYFSIFGILNLVAYHPDFGIMSCGDACPFVARLY